MNQLAPLPPHPLIYSDVLDLIGDTPLVKISLAPDPPRANLWGKLESQNPGGSVKDRICLAMIEQAEASGLLQPGGTVIEPTSGNTGIGLALVCARRGYRCILTMPESMSLERRAVLELMSAEIVLTKAEEQMAGAVAKARQLARDTPNSFMPQQFDNPENPRTHYETTAIEILEALRDTSLDAFVAGIGTGGTISGVGRRLRQERPACSIYGVEPESCATISRGERGPTKIQGLAAGFIPNNYDARVPHRILTVSDQDAYEKTRALARQSGLMLGLSAGGAVHAAIEVARGLRPEQNVVVVLPDTGERYFSLNEYFA